MRGTIGRLANTSSRNCTKQAFISSSSSAFSTFSGGGDGSGRGRGRGGGGGGGGPSGFAPNTQFTPGKRIEEEEHAPVESSVPPPPPGLGHGRGKPLNASSNPVLPSFLSGINPSIGRGRTIQPPFNAPSQPQQPQQPESQSAQPKKPIFFSRGDGPEAMQKPQISNPEESMIPSSLLSGLPGAGRGQPLRGSSSHERPVDENRHIRRRPGPVPVPGTGPGTERTPTRRWEGESSKEEATKKAIGILGRGGGGGGGGGRGFRGGRGGGRGFRGGRGGRGSGGRGGRGGRGSGDEYGDDMSGLKLGNDADGERLAERLGPETMAKLTEAFDEMSYRVLPSPADDAYLDALHTNNMIEYEPEYLVEFDNPDIDDKPPIPLRDALEKMKPFLMAYEGIKSQEEWEEIIAELMERVPAMKELMDFYCGPDRVTAMQQQQELERVAKTLPDNVPSSVKRFTDRAILSLQSNPGWGWDKKCQFMDKLVWEVSQQYK